MSAMARIWTNVSVPIDAAVALKTVAIMRMTEVVIRIFLRSSMSTRTAENGPRMVTGIIEKKATRPRAVFFPVRS